MATPYSESRVRSVRQTAPPLRPQLTLSQGIKSGNLDLVRAHSAVHDGPFLRKSILYGCDGLIRGDCAIDKMDFALLAAAILEHASFGIFASRPGSKRPADRRPPLVALLRTSGLLLSASPRHRKYVPNRRPINPNSPPQPCGSLPISRL